MMTEEHLRLITTAVDGELTPAEARRLRALLDDSAEARAVHAKLMADSNRLRALPPVPPPADVRARVMARVAAAPPPRPVITRPGRRAAVPPRHRWVPVAAAAALLAGVTAASYLFFRQRDAGLETAVRGPDRHLPASGRGAGVPADPAPRPTPPAPPHERPGPGPDGPAGPPRPDPGGNLAVAPEPRPSGSGLIAAPPHPDVRFDLVEVRVPFLRTLAEFGGEETRALLAEELGRDPAFRIDLFTRDPARAVAVFREAAKDAGLVLHADAASLDRVGKRQSTAVVVYTESFTPARLADLMGRLAAEDARISPRVFGAVHATPATPEDEKALKQALGVDPGLFKRITAEKGKDGATKSIQSGTADQIVKSVLGGPAGKGADKSAVLLTWTPVTARTAPNSSAELKQFLVRRGDRKPNAVPVLIVIRPSVG